MAHIYQKRQTAAGRDSRVKCLSGIAVSTRLNRIGPWRRSAGLFEIVMAHTDLKRQTGGSRDSGVTLLSGISVSTRLYSIGPRRRAAGLF